MGQKQRIHPARFAVLFVVLALHVLLLAPSMRWHPKRPLPTSQERAMEVFWFDSPSDVSHKAETRPPSSPRARPARREVAISSAPITLPSAEPPSRIDWNAQLSEIAHDQVRKQEELERQRKRFTPFAPRTKLESKEKLDAGWNEYRFKRVESHPGGTVIHLNERCSIAISGMIMPFCKLGKLKASGEMYEHMKEWERKRDDLP